VGSFFSEETITAKNYRNDWTQLIALLEQNERDCWFQQDGATAILRKKRELSCRTSSVIAPAGVAFGRQSPDLTRGDFLKEESTTQENWRTLNTTGCCRK
jgi:hypothetical protein